MPSRPQVLVSALLFSALAIAQTATPAAKSSQAPPLAKSGSKALTISPNGAATGWRAIHNSALVVDTHADTPGRFVDENFDLSQDAGTGYLDFNKIKARSEERRVGKECRSRWSPNH